MILLKRGRTSSSCRCADVQHVGHANGSPLRVVLLEEGIDHEVVSSSQHREPSLFACISAGT